MQEPKTVNFKPMAVQLSTGSLQIGRFAPREKKASDRLRMVLLCMVWYIYKNTRDNINAGIAALLRSLIISIDQLDFDQFNFYYFDFDKK